MRTTIRLPDELLRQAETLAAETNHSLTKVIEDALRAALARHERVSEAAPVRLPTHAGGGLLPGVDLDDSAALLQLMKQSECRRRLFD